MRPSRTPTSARRRAAPVPSTTSAPLITRSSMFGSLRKNRSPQKRAALGPPKFRSMKLGLGLDIWAGAGLQMPVEQVREAERLGFDSVWTAEAYGADAI